MNNNTPLVKVQSAAYRSRRWTSIKRRIRHFGTARYCPVCGSWLRHFLPAGYIPRPDAKCPVCGAHERHRFVWHYISRYTTLANGQPKRLLHVAPERALAARLKQIPNLTYLSCDLQRQQVMLHSDLTALPHPSEVFDVVYCSHVLEHVPDDRAAMQEIFRVLRPSGWAILNVPITTEITFEDSTITDPAHRLELFGQHDHVRRYGHDYPKRLEQCGFRVTRVTIYDIFDEQQRRCLGVNESATDSIFFCTRSEE